MLALFCCAESELRGNLAGLHLKFQSPRFVTFCWEQLVKLSNDHRFTVGSPRAGDHMDERQPRVIGRVYVSRILNGGGSLSR